MKNKPVMRHDPIFEILFVFLSLLFIVFFGLALLLDLNDEGVGFLCFSIIPIMVILIRRQEWLKWYWFQSSAKETTEAHIVDRRLHDDGKGYTYYVTYQFYTLEDENMFEFEEEVSETVYNWISKGALLTVEYAINDPRLARSSLPKVKNTSWEEPLDDNNDSWKETPADN